MFETNKQKLVFKNNNGEQLAALLERPRAPANSYALFAHCFTCSKDIAAATRISKALVEKGIAVLRFDFTGLGNSEGDFANTNFSSNIDDLVSAADNLREKFTAPQLLIGHSLGGAAVLAAAHRIPDAKAVVTIGAPSDPEHVSHLFDRARSEIESEGKATVSLAGRKFTIKKQFIDDLEKQNLRDKIHSLHKALLIFHSPVDNIVEIDNATNIYQAAVHPKSFISLDNADHLLSKPIDSLYVAETLAAWASRYVTDGHIEQPLPPKLGSGEVLVREIDHKFGQQVFTDKHQLLADEPKEYGGNETGPSPYEYLLGGLGACTSMTLRMYANRKNLPLEDVSVTLRHQKIHAQDCSECETTEGKIDRIERDITLSGPLTQEHKQRLMEIADRCPVHRTLHSEINIQSRLK